LRKGGLTQQSWTRESALATGKSIRYRAIAGTGALVTLAQRKSRLYLVRKVKTRRAADVQDAIIDMLKPYAAQLHTITEEDVRQAEKHLKLRPRKCLGFRQPEIVFHEYLQATKADVALQC
jgi:IS30 family transposase